MNTEHDAVRSKQVFDDTLRAAIPTLWLRYDKLRQQYHDFNMSAAGVVISDSNTGTVCFGAKVKILVPTNEAVIQAQKLRYRH